MGGFFKLGRAQAIERSGSMHFANTTALNPLERHGMSAALQCMTTADMRKELRNGGFALPTDTELIEWSKKLNIWIEAWIYEQRLPPSTSWSMGAPTPA